MKRLTGVILLSGRSQSDTDIRYASGFSAPDPFLFFKGEKQQALLVSSMEKGRALQQAVSGTQVFTPAELGLKPRAAQRVERQIEALMERLEIHRIIVSADFPTAIYEALKKRGVRVGVARAPLFPERAIKSESELACLRVSQQAAVRAMRTAIATIASAEIGRRGELREGGKPLTSERVRRGINHALVENDCSGLETIVAGGEQATDPHERGHGKLYAGQAIILDIFPRSEKTGYWGDITRTVCRGPASKELKKMYAAVKASQRAALQAIRPGVCSDEVHKIAGDVLEQRGFLTERVGGQYTGFIHGTGHGVGLDIHEQPRVGRSGEILQEGHVITVEPGLYYPGRGGIRIEDTVCVVKEGWRYLYPCVKKFELL